MLPALVTACVAVLPVAADDNLSDAPALVARAQAQWRVLVDAYREATGEAARGEREVRIKRAANLAPGRAARSEPGIIWLRPGAAGASALDHEVAHQFLWQTCSAASGDRLFHEAFAVATSGELDAWRDEGYLSAPRALAILQRGSALDSVHGRQALARLLSDGDSGRGLPRALRERLKMCAADSRWLRPVTPEELATPPTSGPARDSWQSGSGGTSRRPESQGSSARKARDAFVALSRHSGEVLSSSGDASWPRPLGSTLKPFLVAGAARPPILPIDKRRPGWECGQDAALSVMDARVALRRSCNGFFLDWGVQDPSAAKLGSYGSLLVALGLERVPTDASEAIGLRPTLSLSPWALAQAYRVLADMRPDVVVMLQGTAAEGTLAGLEASPRLEGLALKTGTVRDAATRVELGWIVGMDADVVAVMAVSGKTPRAFALEFAERWAGVSAAHERSSVDVQVFGLLPEGQVSASCAGIGVTASARGPSVVTASTPITDLVREGAALCLGGPWRVSIAGRTGAHDYSPRADPAREYAGVFRGHPLPPERPPAAGVTVRQRRARRGSDLIFRTTLARYTSGVLSAEDASVTGEARRALALVVAHNAAERSRHRGRPICDTTHCQAFLGTGPKELWSTLAAPSLARRGWLAFARGGDEPWQERRTHAEVDAVLGANVTAMSFASGRARSWLAVAEGEGIVEIDRELACELVRSPLRLRSCPTQAVFEPDAVIFRGHGEGHGEGLDVERAKHSGLDAEQLLEESYP